MRFERIVKESKKTEEVKEVKLDSSYKDEISHERLAAMIFYVLKPSKEVKTSINSYQTVLRTLKASDCWEEKIEDICEKVGISAYKEKNLILSGKFPDHEILQLDFNGDLISSISFYFENLKHPNISNTLLTYFKTQDLEAIFSDFFESDPILLYKFSALFYILHPERLISTFSETLKDFFNKKPISSILEFKSIHSQLLDLIPSGKLLHIYYTCLSISLSGHQGAKSLAMFFHFSILSQKKPESILELYMLCEQKQQFENFYSELCVERLLLGNDIAIEEEICEEIKNLAGPEAMENIFVMLKDAKEYRIRLEKINVVVITQKFSGVLNSYPQIKLDYVPSSIPKELEEIWEDFNQKFKEKYQRKVVKANFLSSMIELRYGKTDIKCNFLQCLILLRFNEKEKVKYNEILKYLQTDALSESIIRNEIDSLNEILALENGEYYVKEMRENFLDLIPRNQTNNEEEVSETDENRQKPLIEAWIMRVMKNAKQMEEGALAAEVTKKLKFLIKDSQIREVAQKLIVKGFLWQVDK